MTKYVLHGGFTKEDNKLNQEFFAEFLRDVPENGKVLFVYFAVRPGDSISEKYEAHVRMCKAQSQGKNLEFIVATEENFLEELKSADAVFFNGGSTSKLLRILKTYPDLRPLVGGKTVAGSSAGAYVLATLGTSHSEEVMREGLGFVPLRVVCHFESSKLPPSMASFEVLKNSAPELELLVLKDFEWKVFRF